MKYNNKKLKILTTIELKQFQNLINITNNTNISKYLVNQKIFKLRGSSALSKSAKYLSNIRFGTFETLLSNEVNHGIRFDTFETLLFNEVNHGICTMQ